MDGLIGEKDSCHPRSSFSVFLSQGLSYYPTLGVKSPIEMDKITPEVDSKPIYCCIRGIETVLFWFKENPPFPDLYIYYNVSALLIANSLYTISSYIPTTFKKRLGWIGPKVLGSISSLQLSNTLWKIKFTWSKTLISWLNSTNTLTQSEYDLLNRSKSYQKFHLWKKKFSMILR